MRSVSALLVLALVALATPAQAQLGSVPYEFTAGTTAQPDEVNTNFSTAYANALNRLGGTMGGHLTFSPTNTYDITNARDLSLGRDAVVGGTLTVTGASTLTSLALTTLACTGCVSAAQLAATTVAAASYGDTTAVPTFTVDADGRLTAASAVATSSLTGIVETAITDGSVLARVAGNESITGAWRWTSAIPQITLYESDQGTNERAWLMLAESKNFYLSAYDDTLTSSQPFLQVARGSGVTVSSLTLTASALNFAGSATFPDGFTVSGNGAIGSTASFQFASYGSPSIGRIFIGDGTGYRMHISTRVGGTTTDKFTFYDTGNLTLASLTTTGNASVGGDLTVTGTYTVGTLATGTVTSSTGIITASGGARGTGAQNGSVLTAGRNTSGSGAAGCLVLIDRAGNNQYLYSGGSYLLRYNITSEGCPTENDANPHTGSVIGDQTSFLASKDLVRQRTDYAAMLATVAGTDLYDFTYKDGRYDGEQFTGIVTDFAPWMGKDHGKSLNEINGFGYLIGAVKALKARVEALEAQR